jgi:tRNA A37 threonylcarbamoyladenosine synthetase subunit TsaC/SUA5/YrdC
VDGGEVTATEPSTVLDALTSPLRVVREGAIPRSVIEQLFAET